TVILLTMSDPLEVPEQTPQGRRVQSQCQRGTGGSAAYLRECAQAAGSYRAALHEVVAFGFDGERLSDQWLEGFTGTQRCAQISLDVAEQAWPQLAVRCEAHAIAAVAEVVAHGRDDTDGA